MKRKLNESGIRDISALRKRYPKAEIYFHQDLDGVTTAIHMLFNTVIKNLRLKNLMPLVM